MHHGMLVTALAAALVSSCASAESDAVAVPNFPEGIKRVAIPEALQGLEAGQCRLGIDVLEASGFAELNGRKVGLITNHTGKARDGRSTIDLLHEAGSLDLVGLFSPEHGIRGTSEEAEVADGRDSRSGLPVHSLYGETRKPTPTQLAGIDTLVFDIQDIGCRFYTYISTMGLAMEAAAQNGLRFVVLDRPNPIGGIAVGGPLLDGETSFTAFHDIPLRHGMTVAELAILFKRERGLEQLDLVVVPCAGWKRKQWFNETGLPWTAPSPNMPDLYSAAVYPGIGLLEFMKLSVGRGTEEPFLIVGAPYLDGEKLAAELSVLKTPGVQVSPHRFTPTKSVFVGEECSGIRIEVVDREKVDAIPLALQIGGYLATNHEVDSDWAKFAKLLVHPETQERVRKGDAPAAVISGWVEGLTAFKERRVPCLLYR